MPFCSIWAESGGKGPGCPSVSHGSAQPYPSDTQCPIVWLPWHPGGCAGPPCSEGVLTFFFQDSLRHKQCWMVGIRAPGSHWVYPVFVISLEIARVRVGFETGMNVSEERSGQMDSRLFTQLGHVTCPHSFHNWST